MSMLSCHEGPLQLWSLTSLGPEKHEIDLHVLPC
eukprot:SAG11_NODE_30076_length_304_cov_1.004878_1_plen_33_part_01